MRRPPMQGRLVRTSHSSACLRGNPLGDPHERDLYVYLPPQYDGTRRFPVVMMLAGFGATHHSIAAWSPWKPNTVELFDRLVTEGACKPALLVLPDCFNRWGGSQFLDSEGPGATRPISRTRSFRLSTRSSRRSRSERRAPSWADRPVASGRFDSGWTVRTSCRCMGSHAGDAAFDVSMRPMLTSAAIAFDLAGGLRAFAEEVPVAGPQNASQFDAVFVLAAAGAYSPYPAAFPFARSSGEPEHRGAPRLGLGPVARAGPAPANRRIIGSFASDVADLR